MSTTHPTPGAPQSHGAYDGAMNVSEKGAREILAQLSRQRAAIGDAQAKRDEYIRAAMRAGVPRQEIAEAAGVSRVRLYQIVKEAE